ncbi:hypothetical protein CR513_59196, partial [Mucuna pruriens]
DENSLPNLRADVQPGVEHVHNFIYAVLRDLLYDQDVCLLHLSSGKYLDLLRNLLRKKNVILHLPQEFHNVLQRGRNHLGLKVFAEAFKMIDNPLVVARFCNTSSEILCPDAVFVDLTICQRKLILKVLFPDRVDTFDSMSKEIPSTNCSSFSNNDPVSDQASDSGIKCDINMPMNVDCFWIMLDNLWLAIHESCIDGKVLPNSTMIKDILNTSIELLSCSIRGSLSQNPVNLENKNEMEEVVSLVDEMKQLSSALTVSGDAVIEKPILVGELCKRILSRQPKVGHVLNELFLLCKKNSIVECEPSSQAKTAVANDDQGQNVLEESNDNVSKNSQGAINSGNGDVREKNVKGKKNKPKKGKGKKKIFFN